MPARITRLRWLSFLALLAGHAYAHVPVFPESGAGESAETPVRIEDVNISRVVYAELTDAAPQLWIAFHAEDQAIKLQLGVPQIERLSDFRPALAVLGPGLPAVSLPFDIPAGVGGMVFTSDDVVQPEVFHEPVTGTDSWILRELNVAVGEAGEYYVVAFSPSGQRGKLWVALGEREQFTAQDFVELPGDIGRVRDYHEVGGGGPPCFLLPAAAFAAGLVIYRLVRERCRIFRA